MKNSVHPETTPGAALVGVATPEAVVVEVAEVVVVGPSTQ